MMKFNLFTNSSVSKVTQSWWLSEPYNFNPNFIEMIKQGLYRVFLYSEVSYNTNLWTMKIEFIGSLLTFSFLALFGGLKRRYLIYVILFFIFYKTYYLAFLLGILLSDIKNNTFSQKFYIKNKALLPFYLFCHYF